MVKKKKTSQSRFVLSDSWIIFFIALLIRFIFLIDISKSPVFNEPVIDSMTYWKIARYMASYGSIYPEIFWQPIVYPILLSIFYFLTHGSIFLVKCIQIIFGGVTAVLTYRLAGHYFERPIARTAGMIVALYTPLIFFETELLGTGLETLCMVALLLAYQQLVVRESSIIRFVMTGLIGSIAILSRPNFLLGVVILSAQVAYNLYCEKEKILDFSKKISAFGAALIAPILMAAALNHSLGGPWSPLPNSQGINAYIGMAPNYDERVNIRPGYQWEKLTFLPIANGSKSKKEEIEYYQKTVTREMLEHPGAVVQSSVRKLARFLTTRELPRNFSLYEFREFSYILTATVWKIGFLGFPYFFILGLAISGWITARRKIGFSFHVMLMTYSLSVVMVIVASRYRMPLLPLLAILASYGGHELYQSFCQKKWSSVKLGLSGMVFLIVIGMFTPSFSEEGLSYLSELYYCVGTNHDRRGDYSSAIPFYKKSIELNPSNTDSLNNLGYNYGRLGQSETAMSYFQKALEIQPSENIYNNLGSVYSKHKNWILAREQFDKALQLNPKYPEAMSNLAENYSKQGLYDQAIALFLQALEINPGSEQTHNNLGAAYSLSGHPDQGIDHFKQALSLNPDFTEALANLGTTLFLQGKLDESKAVLLDTVQRTAAYPIAFYHLAKIFYQQGDFASASIYLNKAAEGGYRVDLEFRHIIESRIGGSG